MYNAQTVRDRIDIRRKEKGINNLETMLKELSIGKSTIWAMTDNKGVGCFALARIADRLDCSVDYLLGRAETPTSTYSISNKNTTINGTQANVINNTAVPTDDLIKQFLQRFEELSFEEKIDVMQYVTRIKTSPNSEEKKG